MRKVDASEPCLRVLQQMDELIVRLGERGLDTRPERAELEELYHFRGEVELDQDQAEENADSLAESVQ